MITRMVPMLSFNDVEAALGLYRDVLGFEVTESHHEDGRLVWCAIKAGATEAMLQYHPGQAQKNGGTIFWIYTDDLDGLHGELKAKGWKVSEPDTENGRREFEMTDAENNPLIFCQPVAEPTE